MRPVLMIAGALLVAVACSATPAWSQCAGMPDGTPCDDGLFCNGFESCQSGVCSNSTGDPCAGPDGDGDCSESCDEAADNCEGPDPDGTTCDDGLFCNGADSCQAGSCAHTGDPCTGPDGDADCLESCDETGDTCDGADPDGALCDDGLFCNGNETCQGGACSGSTGDPCAGPDGDGDCSESCNETAGNCTANDPDDSACDDGSVCTINDSCTSGVCGSQETAPDGTACDDGLFCNGDETCQSGVCSNSTGDPCAGPDGDGDCSESCNETAGDCTANDPDGSLCDDGSVCTLQDSCSGGSCTDHVDATDGTPCDDGLFCNGSDACQAGSCSHSGDPCDGSDGDADCSESCNEPADTCTAPDPANQVWSVNLTVARSTTPGDLELSWAPNCGPAPDYAVYEGDLGDFGSHVPAGTPICSTAGAAVKTITPGPGSTYYLVVPLDAAEETEGSYGYASDGTPRVSSFSACRIQADCNCPGP